MKVTTLDEKSIRDIGHAFGYYDYEEETGMSAAFSGKEATANYICAYVRGVLRGGFLHTTSERGEGYIAYKLPKEKMGLKTMWPIACGMLHNSTLKRLLQFGIAVKRGGASLKDRMDKEKKTYIFVGLVCVREEYQGQGYMRKVLDIAFAEGDRLGVPVILETDAKNKFRCSVGVMLMLHRFFCVKIIFDNVDFQLFLTQILYLNSKRVKIGGEQELSTSQAAKDLELTPTSISRASKQLEEMGLLHIKKEGVPQFYRFSHPITNQYPVMIELFTRKLDAIQLPEDADERVEEAMEEC